MSSSLAHRDVSIPLWHHCRARRPRLLQQSLTVADFVLRLLLLPLQSNRLPRSFLPLLLLLLPPPPHASFVVVAVDSLGTCVLAS